MGSNVERLKEYRFFLTAVLAITSIQIISVAARLCLDDPSEIQNTAVIPGLLVAVWAGWTTILILRLRVWHSALLGVGLSFGTHWALPIFHKGKAILSLILINSIIVAATTFSGGCLAIFWG